MNLNCSMQKKGYKFFEEIYYLKLPDLVALSMHIGYSFILSESSSNLVIDEKYPCFIHIYILKKVFRYFLLRHLQIKMEEEEDMFQDSFGEAELAQVSDRH